MSASLHLHVVVTFGGEYCFVEVARVMYGVGW
jgi:hypothetical protein